MAAHPNRSPSPLSRKPFHSNPKISENNSAVRRSFGAAKPSLLTSSRRFDPVTPANSPSDLSRRYSVDSYPKEKENCEKDHNSLRAAKLQSLAKGSKSFMAPTISAASKFSPSPKKKVLVERNEAVRTSISLSDGKAIFLASTNISKEPEKPEDSMDSDVSVLDKKQTLEEGSTDPSRPSKRVTFSNVVSDPQPTTAEVITDFVSVEVESEYKLSCSSNSISIAPLDADPSLPPYDPKTNYLSPRPRFLHYKPNPRIELLLNKEKGLNSDQLKQLEDSIMAEILSESFSDSDVTEYSQEGELSCGASTDLVVGLGEEIEECPSESMPIPTTSFEENSVMKKESKVWSLSTLTCYLMALMLLIAGASIFVAHSPIFEEVANAYHESKFAPEKMNFHQLMRHINLFSVDSLSAIPNLVNDLSRGSNHSPLQFMNLSGLQDYVQDWGELVDGDAKKDDDSYGKFQKELNSEEVCLKAEQVAEVEEEDDDDDDIELEEAEMGMSEEAEAYARVDYDEELHNGLDPEDVSADYVELIELELENVASRNDMLVAVPQDQSSEVQVESNTAPTEESHDTSSEFTGITSSDDTSSNTAPTEESLDTSSEFTGIALSDDKSSLPEEDMQGAALTAVSQPSSSSHNRSMIMGASVLLLAASAFAVAAAIAYQYMSNPRRAANGGQVDSLKSMKLQKTGHGDTKNMTCFQKNWDAEIEASNDSCPSEMSSFQNTDASYSSSSSRKDQSFQRRRTKARNVYTKEESLNSSAASENSDNNTANTDSPSYGSFTTYEKIPIKKAKGEDEVVTPVRRSSRIRNHHQ